MSFKMSKIHSDYIYYLLVRMQHQILESLMLTFLCQILIVFQIPRGQEINTSGDLTYSYFTYYDNPRTLIPREERDILMHLQFF